MRSRLASRQHIRHKIPALISPYAYLFSFGPFPGFDARDATRPSCRDGVTPVIGGGTGWYCAPGYLPWEMHAPIRSAYQTPGPFASSIEYQFVSSFANRVEAALRTVKKTYNKQASIKMVTAKTL